VPGILGITLVIFSMGASLIGNVGLQFPEMHQITQAIWTMAVTLILGVAMIGSMVKYLPDNKMFNKLVLADQTDRNHGYISSDSKDDLMGLEGVAITSLRPSGTVLIQDRRIDVVSVGDFIEKGAHVKVVDTSGSRVMVTRLG
jgi:membrane-bound serine protease (ClpP class)